VSTEPPRLFDRALRRRRHQSKRMSRQHFLAEIVADRLIERFKELGHDPQAATWLAERSHPGIRNALADRRLTRTIEVEETCGIEHLPQPARNLPAIAVLLTLHTVNDLPGLLLQLRQALAAGGLLLAGFPGGRTLAELRAALMQAELNLRGGATMRVHPMIDVRDAAALMQRAGFSEPVADIERLEVTYADTLALMHELRALGETACLTTGRPSGLTPALLAELDRLARPAAPPTTTRCAVGFELIGLTGWAPPQPPAAKGGGAAG